MEILIGADPEFFVRKKTTGELVSAFGLIAGTKANPIPMGPGHAQVDGMALEINVPPAKNAKEFIDGFNGVMDALHKELPDYDFDFSPVAHFGKEVIDNQPREARELGCEPDFNAYKGGKANPRPNAAMPFRTASGHVHIGWTNEQDVADPDHLDACMMLSKQLDFMIGLPSLVWDEDVTRRELYGKAGCYRPKHYGMEYRTLSNAWLTDPERIKFVVERTQTAFTNLTKQLDYGKQGGLEALINTGNFVEAMRVYQRQLLIEGWFNGAYTKRYKAWQAAEKAKKDVLNKAAVAKNAGKGDVDGKGFPANHLAKVAWGKRQIMFDENPAAEIPVPRNGWLGVDFGVIERGNRPVWEFANGLNMPAVARPAVQIIDDFVDAVLDEEEDDMDWDFDEMVEDDEEEV